MKTVDFSFHVTSIDRSLSPFMPTTSNTHERPSNAKAMVMVKHQL